MRKKYFYQIHGIILLISHKNEIKNSTNLFICDYQILLRVSIIQWTIRLKKFSNDSLLPLGVPPHIFAQLIIVPYVYCTNTRPSIVFT